MFSCLSPPMPAAMKASMLLLLPAVVNAWSIDRVKDAALEPTKNDLDSDMPLRRNPEHEAEVAFSFVSNDTVSAQGTTCSYGLQFPNAHACNAGCDWGHNQGCDQSCDGDCDNWCDHGCDGEIIYEGRSPATTPAWVLSGDRVMGFNLDKRYYLDKKNLNNWRRRHREERICCIVQHRVFHRSSPAGGTDQAFQS